MRQVDVEVSKRPFNIKFAFKNQNRTLVLENVHRAVPKTTKKGRKLIAARDGLGNLLMLLKGQLDEAANRFPPPPEPQEEAPAEDGAGDDPEEQKDEVDPDDRAANDEQIMHLSEQINEIRQQLRAVNKEIRSVKGHGKECGLRNKDIVTAINDIRVYDARQALKTMRSTKLPFKLTVFRRARSGKTLGRLAKSLEEHPIQVPAMPSFELNLANNRINNEGVAYLVEQFFCDVAPEALDMSGNSFGEKSENVLKSILRVGENVQDLKL